MTKKRLSKERYDTVFNIKNYCFIIQILYSTVILALLCVDGFFFHSTIFPIITHIIPNVYSILNVPVTISLIIYLTEIDKRISEL